MHAAASTTLRLLGLSAQDPAGCTATGTAKLTPSDAYPSAALRSCTLDEAQPFLPTISQLLVRTPQVGAADACSAQTCSAWAGTGGSKKTSGHAQWPSH